MYWYISSRFLKLVPRIFDRLQNPPSLVVLFLYKDGQVKNRFKFHMFLLKTIHHMYSLF